MTREESIAYIKAIKNGLHETGKDFPYRDEIIPVAKEALDMAIKALSSSEKPNKWIPVSERLPEEAGMYLCSYDDDYVGTSYFDIRMNEFNTFHEQVTAWMYIPEPYKAEGSDKE